MKKEGPKNSLGTIQKQIEHIQVILIVTVTVLMGIGGTVINLHASDEALNENLKNTAELVSSLYSKIHSSEPMETEQFFKGIQKKLSGVDVISIVDQDNIRRYHTNHALIGTTYTGAFPDFGLHPQGFYTENQNGPSGPQRRAYCEVYSDDGTYIGFTMTIMLKKNIRGSTARIVLLFAIVTILACLIELIISRKISHLIKQKLLGYEPDTFTSMFTIRDNILESISDGIVAADKNGDVLFANKAAEKMLSGQSPQSLVKKFVKPVLSSGEPLLNLSEKTLCGTELLIDVNPVHEGGKISGATAILHDRTEYTRLMEDLSGTKYLVDSMRANNHDFTNKLHVILGLIQIGEYSQATEYIENISIIQRETVSLVMKSIDSPAFAALLIGKIARSSECNVKFILREGSHFKQGDIDFPTEALITICGNLIENALDAMNFSASPGSSGIKELVFGVFTKPSSLLITVDDTGCGISEENKLKVFDNGFSTKGKGRGIGLYHTKQLVESLGGTISFESQEGSGTSFTVSFAKVDENREETEESEEQ